MALSITPRTRAFPPTRISVVEALAGNDHVARRAAEDVLARAYWLPIVTLLQIKWRMDTADAEDVAQDFFAQALEKQWFAKFDPVQARFRTFVRLCLDRFVTNARQASARLKRGGGAEIVPLRDEITATPDSAIDDRFRLEWVRSVFAMSLEALREEGRASGKSAHVAIFEAYDVQDVAGEDRPGYRDLATTFALPETTVTNHLAWARRAFRAHVLATLRALAGSDAEFRADTQELLGIRDA